jgi:hypothetical protein
VDEFMRAAIEEARQGLAEVDFIAARPELWNEDIGED